MEKKRDGSLRVMPHGAAPNAHAMQLGTDRI
jgi:hypothetical protein